MYACMVCLRLFWLTTVSFFVHHYNLGRVCTRVGPAFLSIIRRYTHIIYYKLYFFFFSTFIHVYNILHTYYTPVYTEIVKLAVFLRFCVQYFPFLLYYVFIFGTPTPHPLFSRISECGHRVRNSNIFYHYIIRCFCGFTAPCFGPYGKFFVQTRDPYILRI